MRNNPGQPPISLNDVTSACERLELRGCRPSLRLVRQELGNRGSFGTIGLLISMWRAERQSSEKQPPCPQLKAIEVLMPEAMPSIREAFRAEVAAEVAALRSTAEEKTKETEDVREALSALEEENKALAEEKAALEARCSDLDQVRNAVGSIADQVGSIAGQVNGAMSAIQGLALAMGDFSEAIAGIARGQRNAEEQSTAGLSRLVAVEKRIEALSAVAAGMEAAVHDEASAVLKSIATQVEAVAEKSQKQLGDLITKGFKEIEKRPAPVVASSPNLNPRLRAILRKYGQGQVRRRGRSSP